MKIVNLGSTLRIFPDDLKVEDKIPTGTYDVDFNPMSGYSLTKRSDFETTEKVYGEHDMLADKMVNRYEHSTKNFGVILGGRKGTGKSLTARLVSEKKVCVIDIGNMTMRFIHKIYEAGIHTIVHSNISCTEQGVELIVDHKYPYVDIEGGYKTIHPNEKCRKKMYSSDSAVVTADNYWTVYTILNQKIMNDLKSSDFWKNFKGNNE